MRNYFFITTFLFLLSSLLRSQNKQIIIKGTVKEEKSLEPIEGAFVKLSGSPFNTVTSTIGEFILFLPEKSVYKLMVSHTSFVTFINELKRNEKDTLEITVFLHYKSNLLDTVAVTFRQEPETLVGKPNYSIYDFDFYEDKLILLTSENSLDKAQLQLSNYEGKIFSYYKLPKGSGEAKNFFHDYQGYTELICKDVIFRLDVFNTDLIVGAVPRKDFNGYLKPVSDTLQGTIYFSNQWDKYPSFNYYYLKANDSISHILNSITNEDLMKLYN